MIIREKILFFVVDVFFLTLWFMFNVCCLWQNARINFYKKKKLIIIIIKKSKKVHFSEFSYHKNSPESAISPESTVDPESSTWSQKCKNGLFFFVSGSVFCVLTSGGIKKKKNIYSRVFAATPPVPTFDGWFQEFLRTENTVFYQRKWQKKRKSSRNCTSHKQLPRVKAPIEVTQNKQVL